MNWWQRCGVVGLFFAFLFQMVFIALYALRPWWASYVGRALMSKSFVIGTALLLSIINTFAILPDRIHYPLSALVSWMLAMTIFYQLTALARTPRNYLGDSVDAPRQDSLDPLE